MLNFLYRFLVAVLKVDLLDVNVTDYGSSLIYVQSPTRTLYVLSYHNTIRVLNVINKEHFAIGPITW